LTDFNLHPVDITVIAVYLLITFGIGIYFSRRASRSTEEFFVSGRSLPWWIVGTSMVATTFAADTPLVVSGFTARGGICTNWNWFYCGISGIVAALLFAKLWNRTGVTTDAEFIELRYDGKAATVLRGYKAVWFGLFQNVLIIAWVMRAMAKIAATVCGWDEGDLILGMQADVALVLFLFLLTVVYTVLSGLWGVVATDVVQFCIAMGGSIYLACAAWSRIGGFDALEEKISANGFDTGQLFRIIPEATGLGEFTPFTSFLVIVFVIWWADSSVDGRGYITQRLLAAKDERHATLAYLWYITAFIALRPWPWIVVALCGMAFFGPIDDPECYYPRVMCDVLPVGVFGVMVASFLAAFMSTIDTQLNWGASILVTDLYRRFIKRDGTEKEYLLVSRLLIVFLALAGAAASFMINDISVVWIFVIAVTAGVGSVYITRWYWWRVNAWSELSAFATALVCTLLFKWLDQGFNWIVEGSTPEPLCEGHPLLAFPYSAALTVLVSIPIWVAVTLLTRPVSEPHLLRFYRKVRPGGWGWKKISAQVPGSEKDGPSRVTFLRIALGITALYSFLLGTGKLILGEPVTGALMLAGGLAACLVVAASMRRPPEKKSS
jgi:solute:Na+ symporter, SSS family